MKRIFLLASFALAASAQVKITTLALPDGYTNNIFYSQQIATQVTAPQQNPPLTFSMPAGTFLPPGLNLETSTGKITGFPTAAGTYTFTIQVQINFTGFTDQRTYQMNIATPKVQIITDSGLPNAAVLQPYEFTLQANVAPALTVQWTVLPASLPPGLFMDVRGVISGTPVTNGTYPFTVQAMLANTGATDQKQFTITVFNGAVKITSDPLLPPAIVGQPYNYTLTAAPGNVTWTTPGELPGITLNGTTGKLSGTPPLAGTYFLTFYASAAGFATDSRVFTFNVTNGPLSISQTTLPLGILGADYRTQLTAVGGLAPFLWRVTGTLPPGLTLDLNTGVLSGRPTATGATNFAIEVTDTTGTKFARLFSFFVAGPVTVLTTSLPSVQVGAAYNQTLTAGGGQPPYTWNVVSGDLPPGVLFSSIGTLAGTAQRDGFFQFVIGVVDAGGRSAQATLSVTVGGLGITTPSLLDGIAGTPYSALLQSGGGSGTYTYLVIGGALPAGMKLAADGTLSGTPTASGDFSFLVQVTDSAGSTAQKTLALHISQVLQLLINSLPPGSIGNAYSQTLTASGGTPPYTYSLDSGALPDGFTLDTLTGTISGTPKAASSATFTIKLADKGGQQVTRLFSITIATPVSISTGDLSIAFGSPYSQTFAATGGTAPYTWSIVGGALPAGLTLSSTGILSGTPTGTAGTFSVTVSAADQRGLSVQKTISIFVGAPSTVSLSISAPDTAGSAQQQAVTVSIANAYPLDITGSLTLTFQGAIDDPTARFSTGSRVFNFTIPAGATRPSSGPVVMTGTVAGTITLTAKISAGGSDITPAAPIKTITIPAATPLITSVSTQANGTTLTVFVTGYSNTREMVTGLFHFAPTTGATLAGADLTVQLGTAFAAWYSNSASSALGSQFVLTMPFTLSQGTAAQISSVTVTLSNTKGASAAVSPQ